MNIEDGHLIGYNTQIMNEEEIKKAITFIKFMEYEIENMITKKGQFNENHNQKIRELVIGD